MTPYHCSTNSQDTAGPSLHVVIKLLSTTILVLGPLFIRANANFGEGVK